MQATMAYLPKLLPQTDLEKLPLECCQSSASQALEELLVEHCNLNSGLPPLDTRLLQVPPEANSLFLSSRKQLPPKFLDHTFMELPLSRLLTSPSTALHAESPNQQTLNDTCK